MGTRCPKWNLVLIAARRFTTAELIQFTDKYWRTGNQPLERLYGAALGIHARRKGWGEIVAMSMREEEDVGTDQIDQTGVLG